MYKKGERRFFSPIHAVGYDAAMEMNIRSALKSGKVLFSLFLFVLIILSLIIFAARQQNRTVSYSSNKAKSYSANIDYEPAGYGVYDPNALHNPNIAAVVVNMNWFRIEQQPGVFDWTPADNEIAAWVAEGKKFTLVVRYINESEIVTGTKCNGSQYLPAWEIAKIPHFCDSDRKIIIPDYFDSVFKADLKAYVAAIAQHFANSPFRKDLIYVRVGVGLGGEGFPLMPCNRGCDESDYAEDVSQLEAFGYTPLVWKTWQQEMLAYFQSVFSYTTVIYPIVELDTDQTTGLPVQMEVAYWAAARGMGVGQQGLAPGYPGNYAQIKTILSYIKSHYPNTYIQFQTLTGIEEAIEVQGDINTANQYGAKSIEWYTNDAANPDYQPLFQQWQKMVDNRY